MKRIKIFSSYDVVNEVFHCPSCGDCTFIDRKVDFGKKVPTMFGSLHEYILKCPGCSSEIDYLLSSNQK